MAQKEPLQEGTLRMFWIDAYEQNGVVYLFGKVSFFGFPLVSFSFRS